MIAKGKRIRDVSRLVVRYGGREVAVGEEEQSWVRGQSAMTVKLRCRNARYRDLTPGQPYVVIGIEGDDFRILDDAGRPYLYPPQPFQVLDAREPGDWVTGYGDDGERYAYPAPFNTPGFFEDFFDGRPKAAKTFWRVMNQRLAKVGQVA